MRTFKVATFCHARPGRPLTLSRISAYTLWYNPAWPGCVVYEVEAESGTEAKKVAKRMRLEAERGGR